MLRTFGQTTRTEEEIKENEVNFNEYLGIDRSTMVNDEFDDPFINCTFIDDKQLFVNLYYNYTYTHYHFKWDIENRKIVGDRDGKAVTYQLS